MVGHIDCFCPKQITFLGARHKHNAVTDAECELFTIVHQCRYGQVCQCKQGSSLTNMPAIQMLCRHRHLGYGMSFIYLRNPATGISSKTVCTI